MHAQVIHTQPTQESDSQMRFFDLAAEPEERERRGRGEGEGEGEEGPCDAAITATLSGQANKNEYFSQEISVGTYGGGLAPLGTHTQRNLAHGYITHTGCQNFSPPYHRCHNYHISITAQALPSALLIDLLYEVYNISINMDHSMELLDSPLWKYVK